MRGTYYLVKFWILMKWSFMTVDFKLGCKIKISTYAHISEAGVNNQYNNKTKKESSLSYYMPFYKIFF